MSDVREVREQVTPTLEKKIEVLNVIDDVHMRVDAALFADMFGLASALNEEVQLWVRDDGLAVRQMDEAHVAMTDMLIPRGVFTAIKPGARVKEIRVMTKDMNSILSRLTIGDQIDFSVQKQGKLHVEIIGKRVRRFEMPLFNPENVERRKPAIKFLTHMKVSIGGLQIAIEDARKAVMKGEGRLKELFGRMTFEVISTGLMVTAMSADGMYESGTNLTMGWDILYMGSPMGQEASYGISLMTDIIAAIGKVTNMVTMEYSSNMPLCMTAELPIKGAYLAYWLAPRAPESPEEKEGSN